MNVTLQCIEYAIELIYCAKCCLFLKFKWLWTTFHFKELGNDINENASPNKTECDKLIHIKWLFKHKNTKYKNKCWPNILNKAHE